MRLIDANALIKRLDYCVSQGLGSKIAYMFGHMVDEAPTVDAIPVKWLEDRVRLFRDCGADLMAQSLETEIELWRVKKNEISRY